MALEDFREAATGAAALTAGARERPSARERGDRQAGGGMS